MGYLQHIILIMVSALLLGGCISDQTPNDFSLNNINDSINKALDFLYENQLDYGEFKIYACSDKSMQNCYFDSSPATTTFVLYSLYSIKNVENRKLEIMVDRGIEFLLSEQEPGGIWRYWTSRNTEHTKFQPDIDPDFDDISCVSAVLTLFNQSFDDNMKLFDEYRNEDGVVYTWLTNKSRNEIDAEVNSNILFYFGLKNIEDTEICDFINSQILKENYSSCIYCEDRDSGKNYLPLFYMVSRAYKHGNPLLNQSKEHIINKTLILQKEDGSFGNDLDTAFALNILLNFNYYGKEIDPGINYLLQRQSSNGSWEREVFFVNPWHYLGSEELTTTLVIETLNKYLQIFGS